MAESWRATFLETSAKQNEVSWSTKKKSKTPNSNEFILFQSVADIFHSILMQVERENGNTQEKSSCCIS